MKTLPAEIERGSMAIIAVELRERGIMLPPENAAVVMRCIHASADFDYAENLRFTPGAVEAAVEALRRGAEIVTDTNMALAGISRPGLGKLGGAAYCFMADEEIARAAKERGTTRAAAAMDHAAAHHPGAILAVGNAPTALFRIAEKIGAGLRPALVIGVPVGFVNVKQQKLSNSSPFSLYFARTSFKTSAVSTSPAMRAYRRRTSIACSAIARCTPWARAAGETAHTPKRA